MISLNCLLENILNEKQKQNTNDIEPTDAMEYLFVIFILTLMREHENEKMWEDFKRDILCRSHFFPSSELLVKIKKLQDFATITLPEKTIMYRAREYDMSQYLNNGVIRIFYDNLRQIFPELKLELLDLNSNSVMNLVSILLNRNIEKVQKLKDEMKAYFMDKAPFWGFDKKNCDAPPREYAKAGRANPGGISFLYTASDERTAIMEMRPQIGQCYNIAKIRLNKPAQIFDFTYVSEDIENTTRVIDLNTISKEFSKVNYGNADEYIPTQYICEYLRKKGFDGIRYKSAVADGGINTILFDTDSKNKLYDVIESKLFEVKNMDIAFEQIIPFEI